MMGCGFLRLGLLAYALSEAYANIDGMRMYRPNGDDENRVHYSVRTERVTEQGSEGGYLFEGRPIEVTAVRSEKGSESESGEGRSFEANAIEVQAVERKWKGFKPQRPKNTLHSFEIKNCLARFFGGRKHGKNAEKVLFASRTRGTAAGIFGILPPPARARPGPGRR